jgi:hypothetical protein
MTLVTALAGAALGARAGFGVGALAAAIFSLGSPYGPPHPLLLLAQAAGLGLAGVIGAGGAGRVTGNLVHQHRVRAMVWAGGVGLGATFLFDLLTNLVTVWAFGLAPAVVVAGAVPFFLLHASVNTVVFAALLPVLLPRLVLLGRSPLVGQGGGPTALLTVILLVLVAAGPVAAQTTARSAPAASDSTAAPPQTTVPPDTLTVPSPGRTVPVRDISRRARETMGWQRPLWEPFAPTGLKWLGWYSSWVPVIDGGLAAEAVVLREATTSPLPLFTRDGIPVGTGHVLADDPSLLPTEGLVLRDRGAGSDHWGGTGGLVTLDTADPDPDKAVSGYRGIKGPHETYFRAIHVLTPKAAWRAGFEFEESLDNEGYNFTAEPDEIFAQSYPDEFPGAGKVRQSRTRLFRRLGEEDQLVVAFANGRKTKNTLPTLGVDHMEIWDDDVAATMTARTDSWRWRTSLFWKNRDVLWGDADTLSTGNEQRKLETGKEGVVLEVNRAPGPDLDDRPPLTGVTAGFDTWKVYDTGTAEAWAAPYAGRSEGEGSHALVSVRTGIRTDSSRLQLGLGGQWDRHGGFGPDLSLALGDDAWDPWWTLDLYYGGRAPRSDELLTPLRRVVDTRELALLPNPDLKREKTLRAGLLVTRRLLGIDLAVDTSVRRLEEGITWEPLVPGGDEGIWTNGLEMDAARVTGSLARQGRFLGWGRVKLEGTWQQFDEKAGRASFLPPDKYLRLHLMWENHLFREDGILQLALFSTRQGEMADPWDVTREYRLPSRTVHDLLVGFRLVGAHLSLAFRNLTGEKTRLTAGSLSTGQELDLRLHWTFRY